MADRFFNVSEVIKDLGARATKTILYENERTNGVVWYVPPGEEVVAHWHPATDDAWIIIAGEGEYYLGGGVTHPIKAGMVALAARGEIHGVRATGPEPLVFVAISAPMPVEMVKV
ncbi:MAG: hypothetical protein PWQ18_1313 [Clostridia bacterium]|nr:hypothetical protein [Clostridia bacterium]